MAREAWVADRVVVEASGFFTRRHRLLAADQEIGELVFGWLTLQALFTDVEGRQLRMRRKPMAPIARPDRPSPIGADDLRAGGPGAPRTDERPQVGVGACDRVRQPHRADCSTPSRSQVLAGGLAFGLAILLASIGAIPQVGECLPGQLLAWGAGPIAGSRETAWPALGVSIGIIVVALVGAWVIFERQEL